MESIKLKLRMSSINNENPGEKGGLFADFLKKIQEEVKQNSPGKVFHSFWPMQGSLILYARNISLWKCLYLSHRRSG